MPRTRKTQLLDNKENEKEKDENIEKDNGNTEIIEKKEQDENENNEEEKEESNKEIKEEQHKDKDRELRNKKIEIDFEGIKEFIQNEDVEPMDKDDTNTTTTTTTTTTTNNDDEDNEENNNNKRLKKTVKKTRVKKPRKTIEDSFPEIEPEEASNYTLFDLIKTRIIGDTMKSTLEREKALKQNQNALLRHQRLQTQQTEQQPQQSQQSQQTQQQTQDQISQEDNGNSTAVEYVDGKLTIKSQTIDYDAIDANSGPILYESQDHITNFSFSKRTASRRWSESETRQFIIALKKYGTDFSVLENVFPNRDRRQLKAKFKREQNENPNLLDEIIRGKIDYNMDEYKKQKDEASKQKKEKEEKQNLKNDLMKMVAENADTQDNNDDDESNIRRPAGPGTLGTAASSRTNKTNQEEIVMDTQQYQQQQQQQQNSQYVDPYSMDNDNYGINDYNDY